MAIYLSKEKMEEIFQTYGGDAKNTGSTEGQVALFSYRITELSKHLQTNKQDHACRRSLLALVGQRKRFLAYLHDKTSHATVQFALNWVFAIRKLGILVDIWVLIDIFKQTKKPCIESSMRGFFVVLGLNMKSEI